MLKIFKFILCVLSVFLGSECAKILGVFPTPSISHQMVFRPLMLELAKRGHEVTVITTDPAYPKGQGTQNLIEIDLHDISYKQWNSFIAEKGNKVDQIGIIEFVNGLILNVFEAQLKTVEIQNFLREGKHFDLVFIESCIRPALIFSHIYNAPVIKFSSFSGYFWVYELFGAASHPLIYPYSMQRRVYNLTVWEKITQLYIHHGSERMFMQHEHEENKKLKTIFGPNTPTIDDLKSNVQMLFLNLHPIWDFNRPVPPNVVYVGGLHQTPQRELPKDLKSYLDSSKNGVIYVSFGTTVKTSLLPADKLKILTDVFSQLPYDVVWKWDTDELPGRSKNIKISKWLPQSDLLRHPKIKLFITQGGLQSTDEAITAGVPMIGIPMLGDQWINVEQYVKFNIGKQLLMDTLTVKRLLDAIITVIDDQSYRQNVVRLRDVIYDQPQSPLERAVWWTEHVLRHGGGAHLRAPAAHMSWTEYYEIELVSILLTFFIVVVAVIMLAMYFMVSYIRYYINGKVKVN